jgi:precorrin-8X/cobalt-precorrin-8 methylmutase
VTQDLEYLRDGSEIYRRSFSTIRAETDLSRFPDELETVVVRMIHACGMVDVADDVDFSVDIGLAARSALRGGAPVLADANMVVHGVTRSRLPAHNEVICTLGDPSIPELALRLGTTRSAAAVDLWVPWLDGAVVAIGNAPTALFRLLELLSAGAPRPAAIVGIPVGFVGAAESKHALARNDLGVPWLTVHGRRGGSALAAAAINALASARE